MKLLIILLICSSCLSGQAFVFTDFSTTTGLTFNGSAAQIGVEAQITPDITTQAGSMWYSTPQPLTAGFDTIFTYRMSAAGTPADGMAFVIHNDAAGPAVLGSSGGSLGYSSLNFLANSLVIEFDSYANGEFGESLANRISVHTSGSSINTPHEAFSIGEVAAPGPLVDGLTHMARIEYVPGVLNIYIDNLTVPLLSISYDILSGGAHLSGVPVQGLNLPGGTAFAGFTGGTGGLSQSNVILDWLWSSTAAPIFSFALSQPQGAGSIDVQITNGVPGAAYFSALSFDSLNATNPGGGLWGGMHISLNDLVFQYQIPAPPFRGALDGNGGMLFQLPPGTLASGLPTLYAVSHVLDSTMTSVLQASPVVSINLL